MPVSLPFEQVDVFSEQPFKGNAVAVVIGADRLSSQQMLEFAAWTQLSETTFLLRPTVAEADYRAGGQASRGERLRAAGALRGLSGSRAFDAVDDCTNSKC